MAGTVTYREQLLREAQETLCKIRDDWNAEHMSRKDYRTIRRNWLLLSRACHLAVTSERLKGRTG